MKQRLASPRPTRRRIQKLDRRSGCPDQCIRCRVVLKVAADLNSNAAVRELGCVPSTAVRIVARFRREGKACSLDHRSDSGTRKVDADVAVRVWAILPGVRANAASRDRHGRSRSCAR